MRLPLASLAALLISVGASAQVRQSGTVSPGHLACWTTTGIVQDCGTPTTPAVTGGLGVTSPNRVSVAINSAAYTGSYEQVSLGSTSTGGYLEYTPFGGASNQPFNIVAPSLNFTIGGVTTPFSSLIAGISVANNTIVSNVSGVVAPPLGNTLSAVLDGTLTNTPGSVVYRGAGGWLSLGPGSNGNCLTYVSAGPAVAWGSCAGSGGTGTVTSVATNNGLTGGTITTSGTIGLEAIGDKAVLANISGAPGVPGATSVTALLDSALGSTRGGVAERGASGWTNLTPSASTGLALVSNGSGADPSYQIPALRGFLGGCGTSNDVSNPNTVIDTAACQATSDDALVTMVLAAFTKSTGAWAVGTGNGCLDTGSVAVSTWYHLFVIQRPDTGVVDELCSINATAPTMPANYTKKRRIASFKTDSAAHIATYFQNGSRFDWVTPVNEFNGAPGSTTASIFSLSGSPKGITVQAILRGNIFDSSASNSLIYLSSFLQPDSVPAAPAAVTGQAGATNSAGAWSLNIIPDTNANIRLRVSTTTVIVSIGTYGWIDMRGQ